MRFIKTIISFFCALATTISVHATSVVSHPGELASLLSDHSITSLKVTGEMDARDFKFIADNLSSLAELDLSEVSIQAYSNMESPVFGADIYYSEATIPGTAFFGMPLTKVVLPANLQAIGYAAFAGCTALAEITFPASVDSIGAYAFSSTALASVTIPASITVVEEGAFSRCGNLATVSISSATIGCDAFLADTALTTLSLGKEVKTIGNGAFLSCTALTSINFTGNSITSVGEGAFANTALAVLDLSAQSSLSSFSDWACANTPLSEAKLPESVSTMGDGAFFYASKLQSATLPKHITAIPPYTFAGAKSLLTDTIIPAEVNKVGEYAFYNASSLSHFVIPQAVQHIGTKAMAGNTGLQTMVVHSPIVPSLADSVWAGANQPEVKVDITHTALVPDFFLAEQWNKFHILQNYLLGDVNSDGVVDIADVSMLVSFVLGDNPANFNAVVADINRDNLYDVSDVSLLNEMVLTGNNIIIQLTPAGASIIGSITDSSKQSDLQHSQQILK
ncbi:MAG: leucine-rich repeat protein [Sodaliphilus sp.]